MSKKAIVFLADGTEEMEFTIAVDVLRRAKVEVTVVGVKLKNSTVAECSRGVKIVPDVELQHEGQSWNANDYDAVVCPGGMGGALTLRDDSKVQQLVATFYEKQKIVAFICAATIVAKSSGIPGSHKVTSYPSVKDDLKDFYEYVDDRVVVDQNVVTSRGPGTAFLFALTLVEQLVGKGIADNLKSEMLLTAKLE
ncbi:class I glutamine amidotransferase-like protein [Phascolomyces articulosus]|uniref:D-lactate dehydratase n=1 Tax=Phascolomyces articulosus TaxID=60185 RepID=A0AAD5K550_9FUNG|nr:class I glutamine amidotransferase-like protein [Phascolomyces articulosus]